MNKVLEHVEKVERERMITVDDIKKEYSEPKSVNNPSSGKRSYCVGGALLGYYGEGLGFPDQEELAEQLRMVNPKLSYDNSMTFSSKIIRNNDKENFSNAWTQLRLALNYGKEK